MTTIEKIHVGYGNEYKFRFNFNETIAVIDPNFDILNFDGKGFGYESQDELVSYPSNSSLTLSNLFATNFNAIEKLISNYSQVLPFNYNSTFTIEVIKNNNQYFVGIIDNLEYDFGNYELKIDIVDAVAQYKTFSIDNYKLLDFLYSQGMPGRKSVYYENTTNFTGCYMWGYNATIFQDSNGAHLHLTQSIDSDFLLQTLIYFLLKSIDTSTQVDFDIDWLFGSNPPTANFNQVIGAFIYQRIFGRMLQKRKDFAIDFLDAEDLTTSTPGGSVMHKYPFKKVYDDGTYETWLYQQPDNTGVIDRKVSSVLKMFCRNFFAEYGFSSYNQSYFRKRANYGLSNVVDIDQLIINTPSKEIFRKRKKAVTVTDRFRNIDGNYQLTYGFWGEQDDDDEKLSFDIWFSSYLTTTSSGYNLYYVDAGRKPIYYIKDPVTNLTQPVLQKITKSEYDWNSFNKIRFSLELTGTDYSFLDFYKMTDESGDMVYLKPITMNIDENNQQTKMEAINLLPNA